MPETASLLLYSPPPSGGQWVARHHDVARLASTVSGAVLGSEVVMPEKVRIVCAPLVIE